MPSDFLLYGSTGFLGDAIARSAVEIGLRPTLAGRNAKTVGAQAEELGLEHRVFGLEDISAIDAALKTATVLLHCAGPFIHTFKSMVDACLRTKTHYLDLTGELSVYEALATRDSEAKERGIMVLPGIGFDVVATDCLALHLMQRLPSATRLTLGFHSDGPAGLPPGTVRTAVEMMPYGTRIRRAGKIVPAQGIAHLMIDFGHGPIRATRLTWGDIFMAYRSTGIPNIEDYAVLPQKLAQQLNTLARLRPLLQLRIVQEVIKRLVPAGSTADERARTQMHVWGKVEDDEGRSAASRLHGPEGGVEWTVLAALAVVQMVLGGNSKSGFQTPSLAYGADLVMQCEGVTREDLA